MELTSAWVDLSIQPFGLACRTIKKPFASAQTVRRDARPVRRLFRTRFKPRGRNQPSRPLSPKSRTGVSGTFLLAFSTGAGVCAGTAVAALRARPRAGDGGATDPRYHRSRGATFDCQPGGGDRRPSACLAARLARFAP